MPISRESDKILKWFRRSPEQWYYTYEVQQSYRHSVEQFALDELYAKQYLDRIVDEDSTVFDDDNNLSAALPCTYRISDSGKGYLEQKHNELGRCILQEFRAWLTAAIAVAAFIKSFFF